MAKGNPQWKDIQGKVLVVFQGPHAYISPTWYEGENIVPTWNYIVVHVYGEFSLLTEEQLVAVLQDSITFYESPMPNPWETDLNSEFNRNLMKGTVGFKIKITDIEGKWKLNQNHSPQRRENLVKHLNIFPKEVSIFKRVKGIAQR